MNQIYLLAIASILATASIISGTFTIAAFAQAPTAIPGGDMGSTMATESSNTTGSENMTMGIDNSSTTAPM